MYKNIINQGCRLAVEATNEHECKRVICDSVAVCKNCVWIYHNCYYNNGEQRKIPVIKTERVYDGKPAGRPVTGKKPIPKLEGIRLERHRENNRIAALKYYYKKKEEKNAEKMQSVRSGSE